ncbi:ABC transporter ATP-binding protein [Lentilactobacillus fungorum]|uniref:ABC transporter ATP-binding protein n=1 Tax=Lentilactobacillus fungorum TaxID=2201250 RepID=A0ABQ3VZ45_9LACO|nr:ABC transporter ATP-binding protein [Lentilactobacillus fungorum]GHP14165.1 ABC transporter ATP-binding protein [Lentilactobacillus fungorum]
MTLSITLKNIRKSFNRRTILNGVNLQVHQGEIIGLLGPNGAGKSTLIKLMTGLLEPDSGEITILGQPLHKNKRELRKYLGIAPQSLAIYPQLTVKQNLTHFGAINGLSVEQLRTKYTKVLTTFNLTNLQNQRAINLSGGQKRRLHSAIALMSQAKIIFLDEPTVGADVDSRNQIIQSVKALSHQGITVIYTTHYLQEMEALNAQIIFLNHGVIQATGSVKSIVQQYAHPSLELYFGKSISDNVAGWQRSDDHLHLINSSPHQNYAEVLQAALSNPIVQKSQLINVKILRADLESAYHTLLEKSVNHEI